MLDERESTMVVVAFLGILLLGFSGVFVSAWLVMLLLGAAASIFDAPALALGYWQVFIGWLILSLVAGLFTRS